MDLACRHIQVGDIRTQVWEGGSNQSRTVVLVHDGGYGSDARSCWGTVLELLSEQFHVVAPDLTGFGGTDKIYRFDVDPFIQRVGHLEKLGRALNIDSACFIGVSFGGAVVLRAAIERIPMLSAAVTISGTGGLFFEQERFAELQNYSPSIEGARRVWDLLASSATAKQVEERYHLSLIPGHWETLSAARLRNPAAEQPPDRLPLYRDALSKINVPVLLIAGSDDTLLEPSWEDKMASIIPGSVTRRFDGARHEPQVDQPAEVAEVLIEFVTSKALGGD